jgi:hypothetical protein
MAEGVWQGQIWLWTQVAHGGLGECAGNSGKIGKILLACMSFWQEPAPGGARH